VFTAIARVAHADFQLKNSWRAAGHEA